MRFPDWLHFSKTKEDKKVANAAATADEIHLIKGLFTPTEAADVLLSFLNDKIKFHTIRQLNLEQSDPTARADSKERIEDLRAAKKRVTEMVVSAQSNGELLQIDSTIAIRFKKHGGSAD